MDRIKIFGPDFRQIFNIFKNKLKSISTILDFGEQGGQKLTSKFSIYRGTEYLYGARKEIF
jgi:hypothetical protein